MVNLISKELNDLMNKQIVEELRSTYIYLGSQIGILKHWYNSTLENEEIILKRKQKVNLNGVDKDFLLNLEEDVLYEFFIPLKK